MIIAIKRKIKFANISPDLQSWLIIIYRQAVSQQSCIKMYKIIIFLSYSCLFIMLFHLSNFSQCLLMEQLHFGVFFKSISEDLLICHIAIYRKRSAYFWLDPPAQFYVVAVAFTYIPTRRMPVSCFLINLFGCTGLAGSAKPDFVEARGRISPVSSRRDVLTGKKIGATREPVRTCRFLPRGDRGHIREANLPEH